jgi:hypothetical protein
MSFLYAASHDDFLGFRMQNATRSTKNLSPEEREETWTRHV